MGPSFDESLAKYKQFLGENGYPGDVVWVTPNDVLVSSGPVIYVKLPVSRSNEESVRRLFDLGMSREKGVLFDTLCDGEGMTFSYAWVPRDDAEAEESLMPKGLKLSAKTGASRIPGKTVGSRLRWSYLQGRVGQRCREARSGAGRDRRGGSILDASVRPHYWCITSGRI